MVPLRITFISLQLAEQRKLQNAAPSMLKKIYVLVGLLVQDFLAQRKNELSKPTGIHLFNLISLLCIPSETKSFESTIKF